MAVPTGVIVVWSGAIGAIPAGFVLCDGNNGTPDLRDQFIVGAGDTYAPGDSGGAVAHTHPFTGDGHGHNLVSGADIEEGNDFSQNTTIDPASGTTDSTNHLPPYYALAYIMKVP